MYSFRTNADYSVDFDDSVTISAMIDGKVVLNMFINFDYIGEHRISIIPIQADMHFLQQLEIANKAANWFFDTHFGEE
jgi:hypothetical protein